MRLIAILIQSMQIGLAVMILGYLIMQFRARHKGSPIVRRLRMHIALETTALLSAFITAAFVSKDGYATTVFGQVAAFLVTGFLFVTFTIGTKLFFEIASGKYDDQLS